MTASPEADHWLDSIQAVWPSAQIRHAGRGPSSRPRQGELYLVPNAAHPKLVMPTDRRLAASVLGSHGTPSSSAQRVRRWGLALALQLGLGPWILPDRLVPVNGPAGAEAAGLVGHLGAELGQHVRASMPVTPTRANRKPVLQLLGDDGRPIGFCKVGVNPLTSALVARETAVLAALSATKPQTFTPPAMTYHGQWQSYDVMVCSPLPTAQAVRPERSVLVRAMLELSKAPTLAVAGSQLESSSGSYFSELARRTRAAAGEAPSGERRIVLEQLAALAVRLDQAALESVPVGNWHGDWTPWNCGQLNDQLLVWDWERAVGGVPQGFDLVHYDLQQAVTGHRTTHLQAATDCLDSAPDLLAPWGHSETVARTVVAAYLMEISLRYLIDDQRAAGGFGGAVEDWALPVISDFLTSTTPTSSTATTESDPS